MPFVTWCRLCAKSRPFLFHNQPPLEQFLSNYHKPASSYRLFSTQSQNQNEMSSDPSTTRPNRARRGRGRGGGSSGRGISSGRGRGGRFRPYPDAPLDESIGVMRGFSSGSVNGATAANPAFKPRATEELSPVERSAMPPPIATIGRHFSERRFADMPISDASKAGIKHEYVLFTSFLCFKR